MKQTIYWTRQERGIKCHFVACRLWEMTRVLAPHCSSSRCWQTAWGGSIGGQWSFLLSVSPDLVDLPWTPFSPDLLFSPVFLFWPYHSLLTLSINPVPVFGFWPYCCLLALSDLFWPSCSLLTLLPDIFTLSFSFVIYSFFDKSLLHFSVPPVDLTLACSSLLNVWYWWPWRYHQTL